VIVSHQYRFIFIKTRKTAGTSVEIALSKYCGPDDILARISPEDEATRRERGYPGAQNYELPLSSLSLREWGQYVRRRRRPSFFNHVSATAVRQHIDSSVWESYYKFSLERNPFDRILSSYYWVNRQEPRPPLTDWLRAGGLNLFPVPAIYRIDGRIAVDDVFRYEDGLDHAMERVAERLELPDVPELARAKTGVRTDRRSHREVLGDIDRSLIETRFAETFQDFDYEW
jgi:hypothetical protein